jgi:hypothetical protein
MLLRAEEKEWIEAARSWVMGHFGSRPEERYAMLEEKLTVVCAILENGWIEPHEIWKLQALGIAFGDAVAQKLMFEWVTIEDDDPCFPALNWPGTSILSFPLTTISKRIEKGEVVDVRELFEWTCASLTEMAFSGRCI